MQLNQTVVWVNESTNITYTNYVYTIEPAQRLINGTYVPESQPYMIYAFWLLFWEMMVLEMYAVLELLRSTRKYERRRGGIYE